MKRCSKCLLPETYPKISFDKQGVCSYCRGENHFGIENKEKIRKLIKNKEKLKNDFEQFLHKIKGKNEYDCLLLLSGGKDSIYLLYILKNKYNLNVLTYTVDTGLMNPIAKKNIAIVIDKLNVDHIFYKPGNDFFKKLYRFYLKNPISPTFCDKICEVCSNVIHGLGLIEASKRKIPFVALGYSPDQTDHFFYKIPREELNKNWIPEELLKNKNHGIDLEYFWNPEKTDFIPELFLPFHVIDYPSIERIYEAIEKLGLVKKRHLNFLKTNCYLAWLLHYLDLNVNGYTPYIKDISRNIQMGKLQLTLVKKIYYMCGLQLLKHNLIKRSDKKYVLDQLNLKINDILAIK